MSVSPSELRANIYRMLDAILETGVPLEVERNGRVLRIVPVDPPTKLSRLVGHPDAIVGDPEDLVGLEWSGAWEPDRG
jgi:antitoxin (DNA-binding transcriptional repressor) of toxin-antitoxin stability system